MKNRRLTYWTILLNPVFIVVCAETYLLDDTAEPGIYRGLRAGTAFSVSALSVRGTAAERALGAWLRPGRPGMDPFLDGSLFSQEEEIFRG